MKPIDIFLSGINMAQCLVIALFFLRFKRKTGDAFFGCFAAAFSLLSAERILLVTTATQAEYRPAVYLVRLAAYLIIIWAVLAKNRSAPPQA